MIELSASIFEDDSTGKQMQELCRRVVDALQTSGFLLVTSPFLPLELQQSAVHVTQEIFQAQQLERTTTSSQESMASSSVPDNNKIIDHPTDPKQYLMVDCHSRESMRQDLPATTLPEHVKVLSEYVEALETVKMQLLECIAMGLKLPNKNYLVDLHQTRNSVLRLLHYHDVTETNQNDDIDEIGDDGDDNQQQQHVRTESQVSGANSDDVKIRCKAHSDYGSLTLLLTDGVPGLQAFVNGQWMPVPHLEGALVVNIGSLLSEWTNGVLLATLHRVVHHDTVRDSSNSDDNNQKRSGTTRTSLAFFADPDPNVSTKLKETGQDNKEKAATMSVSEYIQYRSGGTSAAREGVQFTAQEQGRLESITSTNQMVAKQLPQNADPEELAALWKGALEVFIHQLLYVRRIYPRDTFASSRFLETQCHVCRHPGVVSYIQEALEVVVAELLSDGDCDELVVEIYDQVDMTSYEEYYISFDSDTKTVAPIAHVEKDLRDLICSVGTVGRVASQRWPDSVSFKILLHRQSNAPNGTQPSVSSSSLESKWYRAYRKKDRTEERRRIIYDVPSCGCTFQYQIHDEDTTEMDMD